MEFHEEVPIFRQIADYMEDMILRGLWKEGDRIPSVRDLSVRFRVNPNTVNKSFAHLQDRNVIYMQRGIGYFVCPAARTIVREHRRERFLSRDLPDLFRNMEYLGIDGNELIRRYEEFSSGNDERERE